MMNYHDDGCWCSECGRPAAPALDEAARWYGDVLAAVEAVLIEISPRPEAAVSPTAFVQALALRGYTIESTIP